MDAGGDRKVCDFPPEKILGLALDQSALKCTKVNHSVRVV